mmetsp:Transcript_36641/g.62390  ORF Transcript_36641/g.62390 Transcript_36641/m.62390 type:complete len:133 (+) Transcript_36641:153-551(+)
MCAVEEPMGQVQALVEVSYPSDLGLSHSNVVSRLSAGILDTQHKPWPRGPLPLEKTREGCIGHVDSIRGGLIEEFQMSVGTLCVQYLLWHGTSLSFYSRSFLLLKKLIIPRAADLVLSLPAVSFPFLFEDTS